MQEIQGVNDLRTPAEREAALAELVRELPPARKGGCRWLCILGSFFIGTGVLLLPTIFFALWGFLLIGTGCLLRVAARP